MQWGPQAMVLALCSSMRLPLVMNIISFAMTTPSQKLLLGLTVSLPKAEQSLVRLCVIVLRYYILHSDPTDDVSIVLDGKTITVPQGKPVPFSKFSTSSFSQSEYLVYKESQARIRYLLKLKFS